MSSSPPNKLFDGQKGFPTPNYPPIDYGCRVFYLPADEEFFGLLMGALFALINPYNWYENGEMTIAEAVEFWQSVIDQTYEDALIGSCPAVRAPYWDSASDNEIEVPPSEQTWYGQVTDWLAPVDELDFTQNLALWALTGFVAYAGGVGSAIFFRTTAKQFVIAIEGGDIPEIIRIVVDSASYEVDTTGKSGEIIEQIVQADPDLEEHDIYVIKGDFP